MSDIELSQQRRYQIVEQFSEGRQGKPELCEDVLVVTDDYIAVFDGCTDQAGVPYHGMTSGRFAATVLADAVTRLPARASFPEAAALLTSHLNAAILAALPVGTVLKDRPSASAVLFNVARREVWRLGDLHYAVDDQAFLGGKVIDEVTAHARAAYTQVLLAAGMSEKELRANDPGRQLILPILALQHELRNAEGSRYAYGMFDGLPVPGRFLEVMALPAGAQSVVIASDGFLMPAATLALAEEHLQRSLSEDPLRVGVYASTKGVRPGAKSFDDRTYIRLHLR